MLPTVDPMKSGNKAATLPTVKVEIRQENKDRKAGRVPVTLEINSNEVILPDAASDYEVGLLKFVTDFDSPSVHIPEDRALEFKLWEEYINTLGHTDFRVVSTAMMSGTFYGAKDFCEKFTKAHMYKGEPTLEMIYEETSERMVIKVLYSTMVDMVISVNEKCKRMFDKHFHITENKFPFAMSNLEYLLMKSPGEITLKPNEKITSHTDDYSDFYNFDHIQLMTNLPITQTLASAGGGHIVKISTLGNITTNPSVEESYARGGLLYLPNFKIISSLTSDTPLTSFKITPYIFYRTGHSESMVLSVGSSCYAAIEFTPK